jgi:carbon storage regulator
MLNLSRKAGETITIGDDITIEVRRIYASRVTIAVIAPRDVRILRGELEDRCTTTNPATTEAKQTKSTTHSSTPAGAAD